MKTIIINTSPRKGWNTAQLLKEAQKGAESAGSEVEYVDLYDLDFKGCRSCLACKAKDAERCKCYWKDDLSPLIERIMKADALIVGSPIYFGEPTAAFRALIERLFFCVLSYDSGGNYFKGKLDVGIIYTMNAPKEFYESGMRPSYENTENMFRRFFNGEVRVVAACNTVQVKDYSKYSMGRFDPDAKLKYQEENFPGTMKEAFKMSAELGKN